MNLKDEVIVDLENLNNNLRNNYEKCKEDSHNQIYNLSHTINQYEMKMYELISLSHDYE